MTVIIRDKYGYISEKITDVTNIKEVNNILICNTPSGVTQINKKIEKIQIKC